MYILVCICNLPSISIFRTALLIFDNKTTCNISFNVIDNNWDWLWFDFAEIIPVENSCFEGLWSSTVLQLSSHSYTKYNMILSNVLKISFVCNYTVCMLLVRRAVVLNLGYLCHLWHFDQKLLTLCLYFYVTLLTQRC